MTKNRRVLSITMAALVLPGACTGSRSGKEHRTASYAHATSSDAVASPARSGTALHQDPEMVLRLAMDGMLFTAPSNSGSDTLGACSPDYAPVTTVAVADYAIRSLRTVGDTARALVEITTVVTEESSAHDADAFDARLGVAVDTLHETLVREPSGLWKICDAPDENLGIAHPVDADDAHTHWTPRGASWKDVPGLIDSVRAARHRA